MNIKFIYGLSILVKLNSSLGIKYQIFVFIYNILSDYLT